MAAPQKPRKNKPASEVSKFEFDIHDAPFQKPFEEVVQQACAGYLGKVLVEFDNLGPGLLGGQVLGLRLVQYPSAPRNIHWVFTCSYQGGDGNGEAIPLPFMGATSIPHSVMQRAMSLSSEWLKQAGYPS